MEYALYIASVLGAVALYLMMPRKGFNPRVLGALLGVATLGGLWLNTANNLPAILGLPGERIGMVYYFIFSLISIGSAVRVITHTKPVYSALWFVMVVLSSAGLFLLLGAEFMAMAMVIIYGGAILVTYVFVIMLAAHAEDESNPASDSVMEYDRVAREPLAAVAAGFLLLAVLLSVAFSPLEPNPAAAGKSDRQIIGRVLSNRSAQALSNRVDDAAEAATKGQGVTDYKPLPAEVADTKNLDNVERVGVELFSKHPLGLELAGVVLLISLVGAVVIAKQRVTNEAAIAGIEPGATHVHGRGEPGPDSPEVLGSLPLGSSQR